MVKYRKFQCPKVRAIFDNYPAYIKPQMLFLRELIFKVAAGNSAVGEITELIRWGEPSYATLATNSGTTIRLDWKPKTPQDYYLYFHCRTTLVSKFKEIYGELFTYGGNRSLIFNHGAKLPVAELSACLDMALTYRLSSKSK